MNTEVYEFPWVTAVLWLFSVFAIIINSFWFLCVFSDIFKDDVKYILCLATPIDIVLLAVTFTSKRLGKFIVIPLQNFDRDLGENHGEFLAGEITEISVRSWRDLKISAAKNTPKFSPRSQQDLKISSRFSPRSWWDLGEISKSRRPKTRQDSRQDLKISSIFSPRSQNLGSQID